MLKKTKYKIRSFLIFIISVVISTFLFSCQGKNRMRQEYNAYVKGYDAAKDRKPKPAFWADKVEKEGYEQGGKDLQSEDASSSSIEFRYTEEEINALQNKWTTFEEVVAAAFNGNSDAMFMCGLRFLYGGDSLPIDVEKANMFFSEAASLGHAPSLEKIRFIYLDDDPNPFIHQVYLNLIIATGHSEYTQEYHRIRNEWVKKIDKMGGKGNAVVKEIERLAQEKMMQIDKNIITLNTAKKDHDIDLFILKIDNITALDKQYNMDYWLSIAGVSLK